MARTSKRKAANAGSENGGSEDEDSTMVETEEGATPASPEEDSANKGNEEKPSAKKKRQVRKRRRGKDDEEGESDENEGQKQKRARLKSPGPSKKDDESNDEEMKEEEDSSEENGESEVNDSEMKDPEASAASDNNGEAAKDASTSAAKKVPPAAATNDKQAASPKRAAAKKKAAQQTPGKKSARNMNLTVSTEPDPPEGEMAVPTRETVVASSSATTTTVTKEVVSHPAGKAKENGSSTVVEVTQGKEETAAAAVAAETEDQEHEQQPPTDLKNDYLAKTWVWFLVLLAVHVAVYSLFPAISPLPIIVDSSNGALEFYKKVYFRMFEPPKRKIVSPAILEEISQKKRQHLEQITEWMKELKQVQKELDVEANKLAANAEGMENDLDVVMERIEGRKTPVAELNAKLTRLEKLLDSILPGDVKITPEALAQIRNALSAKDENKLLDLTSLDLWEIPEIPEKCGNEDEDLKVDLSGGEGAIMSLVVSDRLQDWLGEMEALVKTSTQEIIEKEQHNHNLRDWLKTDLKKSVDWEKSLSSIVVENVTELVLERAGEKEKEAKTGGSSSKSDSIQAQIQDRLEIDIADHTGEIDYASVRNGARIIRRGPRATSRSLVQNLPFFNRLQSLMGLRFYGHGPEAALTPTDPPDALGQCWSFLSEEAVAKKRRKQTSARDFSLGSVATLAVTLPKPIYVHSIAIEHPPLEVTDRAESAIRIFRVIGYEDAFAREGSYELGRFEYKLEQNQPTRLEYLVARHLARRDVPKLRSIVLAIESTWGQSDDYGCLYRFRVHGDENEDE